MSLLEAQLWVYSTREGECFIYHRGIDDGGYGRIRWEGKYYRVHHLAYTTFVGPLLRGQVVCHRCDHPACWCPQHLFAASQAENMRDRARKGRYYTAEGVANVGTAHLTAEQVREIREQWSLGNISRAALARLTGVSAATIYAIVTGATWKQLKDERIAATEDSGVIVLPEHPKTITPSQD